MKSSIFATAAATGLAVLASGALRTSPAAADFPNDDKAIVHVLNRVAFGPRPGDVERVRAMGLQAYIEQQLHPERIADAAMDAKLSGLTTVGLSSREIAEQFEQPLIEARRLRQQQGDNGNAANPNPPPQPPMPEPAVQRANAVLIELGEQKMLRAIYSERQLQEVLADFWFNHFNVDARKGRVRFMLTEYEREVIRPHVLGKFRDLLGATAQSPAMLFYLDNWLSADPNAADRDAPRPLFRRDRFGRPVVVQGLPRRIPQDGQRNPPRGLNENYGRELMELHTLGVDGGYTQKDVTEVARAFTGWTIEQPRQGGDAMFDPRIHDPREKIVLGHKIRAGGGENDGEQVLDILAKHPSTSRFIAMKLARRFVSDAPPPALVDRAAKRFRDTDGDLREVVRTILTSPEFLSPDAYRAKVKTPLEFVVGAVRVTGTEVPTGRALVGAMQQLGMPLYQCQPPTGYKDTADAWVNTGALVNRMNFAVQLASSTLGRGPGGARQGGQGLGGGRGGRGRQSVATNQPPVTGEAISQAVSTILAGDVSDTTRATIAKATSVPQMTALALGSPEFQRR
ncbi:MAG: DUF1800 domain-containing protein [Vicinamibacterales bacterium]|mgnify:CR=1 FL=1